ncbi:MAG: ATP-binding cassette domain-containing protein [Anaeroplasmataceae bacterium]|nr:ATP-binding cassette domain-containing protein [Anaeroplasmataceae bacterium]
MQLKLHDVSKSYYKAVGVSKINLMIEEGKLYLFLGENGSGKSTTIKLISKVIFPNQQNGSILNEFKKIIYLPDKRNYPKLIKTSLFLKYFLGKDYVKEKVIDTMKRYHLSDKPIGALSKGMVQKLGIIQCILSNGDLYIFDEPTDGLDTISIQIFKQDLQNLLEHRKTIIISTHSKGIFKEITSKIYHFKEGRCNEKK